MLHLLDHIADKNYVIWDWNGTLLDDVVLCAEIGSQLAVDHGLPVVPLAKYLEHFRFPVVEYYRAVGFDAERTPYAEISRLFHQNYRQRAHELRLHAGATDLLTALVARGVCNCVLSATQQDDLDEVLASHGLSGLFKHAFGLADRHAASKLRRGQELLEVLGAPREEVILIGDTDHDLEVGQALAVDVLLVGGGHQSDARLRARHHRVLSR